MHFNAMRSKFCIRSKEYELDLLYITPYFSEVFLHCAEAIGMFEHLF